MADWKGFSYPLRVRMRHFHLPVQDQRNRNGRFVQPVKTRTQVEREKKREVKEWTTGTLNRLIECKEICDDLKSLYRPKRIGEEPGEAFAEALMLDTRVDTVLDDFLQANDSDRAELVKNRAEIEDLIRKVMEKKPGIREKLALMGKERIRESANPGNRQCRDAVCL